jgi:predicted N-formylglutamate amidohydrolase
LPGAKQNVLFLMPSLVITCEHAGNEVPDEYSHLFSNFEVLNSHRGWDPGALEVAEYMSRATGAASFTFKITRLLIELNRSLESDALFSEFSTGLDHTAKQKLIKQYYVPYRKGVEQAIDITRKPATHLSIHTFTPVFNGVTRTTDIGILFDPSRNGETNFSVLLLSQLKAALPGLVIEFNKPYAGIDDGFTTYLRSKFNDEDYSGIEIEISQKYAGTENIHTIAKALTDAVQRLPSNA